MFLRFILTQLTFYITFEEFNRIIKYSDIDFNYEVQGPYLIKSSKIPPDNICHKFYEEGYGFVDFEGEALTHKEYMQKVKNLTLHHNQFFEIPLVAFTLLAGIFIEILGFLTESQVLIVIDNLLTMLLPHWTLYINTVSWGDLCIEDSLVFKILGF